MATQTPWGISDFQESKGPGIIFYGTPSHGGYHVSAALNQGMPDALRLDEGWYEEDCDWALVALAFPERFSEEEYGNARLTVLNWRPECYEAFYGVKVLPGQSYMREKIKTAY